MVTYEEMAQYAFMLFALIAIVAGLAIGYMAWDAPLHWNDASIADANGYITLLMLILGLIVGLISITAKEVTPFLLAAIALMTTRVGLGSVTGDVWAPLAKVHGILYYWATGILNYIVAFVAPAAIIIAIRSIWALARQK